MPLDTLTGAHLWLSVYETSFSEALYPLQVSTQASSVSGLMWK